MVKPIIKLKKKTARVIFWIGWFGVIAPHAASLIGVDLDLNLLSHSLFELASAIAIYLGYINK